MRNFRQYKGLLLYVGLGLLLSLYQNCSQHNHFEGSTPVTQIDGDVEAPTRTIEIDENGEGYMGKLSFVKYDSDNSCSSNLQNKIIERAIDKVNGSYYLAVDNCVDIPDVEIPAALISEDPLDPTVIVYQDEPLKEESANPTSASVHVSCNGIISSDPTFDYIASLTIYGDAAGSRTMDFHVQQLNKDGSLNLERKKDQVSVDTENLFEDEYHYKHMSVVDPAHIEMAFYHHQVSGRTYIVSGGETPDIWFPELDLECAWSN